VVCLSSIGTQATHPNLLNQLGLMEQTLRNRGVPIGFLRAAWFMENFAADIDPALLEGVFRSFLHPLDNAFQWLRRPTSVRRPPRPALTRQL
jgi:uncharacterized protein YbjT (DUF2867 family)